MNESGTAWYEQLRERYRPNHLEVLLIGESPPDPGDGSRRFFYSPVLAREDNLYRGVAKALFEGLLDVQEKPRVLERLRTSGFWLIDAVDEPINKRTRAARRRLVADRVDELVTRVIELAPSSGAIIVHGLVYEVTASPLRAAGVRVLHDEPLPFPIGNWRAEFARGMRAALDSS